MGKTIEEIVVICSKFITFVVEMTTIIFAQSDDVKL